MGDDKGKQPQFEENYSDEFKKFWRKIKFPERFSKRVSKRVSGKQLQFEENYSDEFKEFRRKIKFPGRVSKRVSKRVSERVSKRVSERVSERVSKRVSDRVSDRVSKSKCNNHDHEVSHPEPITSEQFANANIPLGSGHVVGSLVYHHVDGEPITIDCRAFKDEYGTGIPSRMYDVLIDKQQTNAKYILVAENFSAYLSLSADRFFDHYPCILVTSNESPNRTIINFLMKIRMELKLPLLGFVDSTPNGVKMLSTYGFFFPDIVWLGLKPSDLDNIRIPNYCLLKMKRKDIVMAKELLKDEVVKKNPGWIEELNLMLKSGKMVEIDATACYDLDYILKYVLSKIVAEDLIDHREATTIRAAGKAWDKTMISDSDYTEFENFSKWHEVSQ